MKISNTYINGFFCNDETGKNFELINPSTESSYGSLICSNEEQVNNAIDIALSNEDTAANLKISQRIEILHQILNGLNDRSSELSNAITLEMGAPIKLTSSAHIQMGVDHLQNTIKTLKDYSFEEDFDEYQLVKVPIGLVALITPWNWPMNQTLTKISSAIAAGCPINMKHSEYSGLSRRIHI